MAALGGLQVAPHTLAARKALDEPHLNAEELEKEIGDSEEWDEDSHGAGSAAS